MNLYVRGKSLIASADRTQGGSRSEYMCAIVEIRTQRLFRQTGQLVLPLMRFYKGDIDLERLLIFQI